MRLAVEAAQPDPCGSEKDMASGVSLARPRGESTTLRDQGGPWGTGDAPRPPAFWYMACVRYARSVRLEAHSRRPGVTREARNEPSHRGGTTRSRRRRVYPSTPLLAYSCLRLLRVRDGGVEINWRRRRAEEYYLVLRW
jgi:hypothetical protein